MGKIKAFEDGVWDVDYNFVHYCGAKSRLTATSHNKFVNPIGICDYGEHNKADRRQMKKSIKSVEKRQWLSEWQQEQDESNEDE